MTTPLTSSPEATASVAEAASGTRSIARAKDALRLPELDVLRFFAVTAVILFHNGFVTLGSEAALPHGWLVNHLHGGWLGVDLFFVLSGFLVSGLLFQQFADTGGVAMGRFLVRRALKIYPAFYVMIACSWAAIRFAGSAAVAAKKMTWAPFLSEAFFVQNYGPHLWGHTWSLAVEEHFYLLLAVAVVVLLKTRRKLDAIPLVCGVVAVVALALRFVAVFAMPGFPRDLREHATHLRLDSLSFGVLLAYLHHRRPELLDAVRRRALVVAPICAALVLGVWLAPFQSAFTDSIGFTLAYLGFGGVLVLSLPAPGASRRIGALGRAMANVGKHSYSIYLWHLPVQVTVFGVLMRRLGGAGEWWAVRAPCFVLLSFAVGIVMAKLVETPVLRLRDRVFPRASHQALTAPRTP